LSGPIVTYPFVALHAFGHFLEVVVVRLVDVAEDANLISCLQAGSLRWAAGSDRVYPSKRFLGGRWQGVGQDRLLRAAGWNGFGVINVGKVLVKELLYVRHEILVVVSEPDDPSSRGSDYKQSVPVPDLISPAAGPLTLGHVDICSREPISSEERRLHVHSVLASG